MVNDENQWRDSEVSTGTTIIALEYKDGVIIAADSRTSSGTYVANRVTDKLTKVTDYVYCCRSGSAADTQAIADIVSYNMYIQENSTGKPASVSDVAREFKKICYDYRSQLTAGIIVAGFDINGINHQDSRDGRKSLGNIFSIPLGGMIFKEKFSIGGSGSSYIYGFMENQYKDNMTEKEAEKLATEAVGQAIIHDGSSGGVIRLAFITKDGVKRKIFKQQIYDRTLPPAILEMTN